MVSFVCNSCQETLKKPKLDQHASRCRYHAFTCIDCNTDFKGTEYRLHTACISEAEKYQKALYKQPVKQQPKPEVKTKADTPIDKPTKAVAVGDFKDLELTKASMKLVLHALEKKKFETERELLKYCAKKLAKKEKVTVEAMSRRLKESAWPWIKL